MEESHARDVAAALAFQTQTLQDLEKQEMALKEQSLLQSKAALDRRDAAVVEYNVRTKLSIHIGEDNQIFSCLKRRK